MKKLLRVFIAVPVGDSVRARASELIGTLSGTTAKVKWVDPHQLHLTLKFLGDVPQRDVADVCRAASRGAQAIEPFDLEIRGAGAFPHAARPRTVWLGAAAGADRMIALYDSIETTLAELGFRKEHRRFQPHLTLGRVLGAGPSIAELGTLLGQHADFSAGMTVVDEAAVYASTLTPAGPIYELLGAAPLKG